MRTEIQIRKLRWALAGVVLLGAVLGGGHSLQAAGLLIADGGLGGMLALEQHQANVTINNGIAVTEVIQVFRNLERRQVEALYVFPVPKGASVSNFSMWIGGQEMVGEVVEAERAREIYNSYKRRRRDPGLLEQTDYKTFEMRIFPIAPQAEQRVSITYYQQLDVDHDWATYVYPLATTTRDSAAPTAAGRFSFSLEVKSEIPIAVMESPSHGDAFAIAKHSDAFYQASLEAEDVALNRDVVVGYRLSRPRTGIDVIISHPPGEDGYFCLTMTAGEELAGVNDAMDYVFILDVSGSMAHDGKLRLSRDSIGAFIETLGGEDRLEVITFNVAANTLFNELRGADDQAKAAAMDFLASQRAKGGTVLRPALGTAYKYADSDRTLNVIILSDGMTEQDERRTLLDMIARRPANARVFCVGVGNEVNRPLLQQLAEDAGGLAAFISDADNFQRQASAFRRKLMHPVAANLSMTFDGAEVYDVEPPSLPNLYHGTPVRLYGRFAKPGNATVTVRADVQGAGFEHSVPIDLSATDQPSPEIERMWAWNKVQRLLKDADRAGGRDSVIDEIVRLGEGYSIATEYTSFLVLENDAEYKRWRIDRRNALRVTRDRVARKRLKERLEDLRMLASADLGPAVSPVPGGAAQDMAKQVNTSSSTQRPSTPRRSRRRSFDLIPNGGGALDPVSGGLIVGLLALGGLGGAWRSGRRHAERSEPADHDEIGKR